MTNLRPRAQILFTASLTLLAACAVAQSPVDGNLVQAQLTSAINSGQGFYVLPDATIHMTKSLSIPAGTQNFMLVGQTSTRLIRSVTGDFPLLIVGSNTSSAFSNSNLYIYPNWAIPPIADGQTVIAVPPGVTVAPGWYVIAGTHPTNDLVSISATVSFNFKRELVRVVSQSGTAVTLSEPVGREFETPTLFQLETNSTPASQRAVTQNVQIINLAINGRLGDIVTERTIASKAPQVSKAMAIGLAHNVTLDGVRVGGFYNSGIGILMSKRVTVTNSTITDGGIRVLGYGIEISGSRFCTVSNSTMQDTRYGVLFQAGSMDGTVLNCDIPPGRGGFDVGHGQDERRLVYDTCRADRFVIGNQSWLRGSKGLTVTNSTAYIEMFLAGGVNNVLISGKHPSELVTAPTAVITTSYNAAGNPTGPTWPLQVRMEGVTLGGSFFPGRTLFFYSPNAGIAPRVGNLTIANSLLRNPFTFGIGATEFGSLANSGVVRFENSTIENSATGSAVLESTATGSGSWDVTVQQCALNGPSGLVLRLLSGAKGVYRLNGSQYNGSPITASMVQNQSGSQASFQINP